MTIIDIEHIIKDSDSNFLKNLPSVFVKAIAVVIRQKQLNKLFKDNADYVGVDFPPKVLEYLNVKTKITGEWNLPKDGRCIFVANHPFGFLDGLVLFSIIGKEYGDLRMITNDDLGRIDNLTPIIANVKVFEQSSKQYITELNNVYKSDLPITNFPAGLVSRIKDNKVKDQKWQKSFIKKAIETKRDIVPIRIKGRNSMLFYTIFISRNILKINTNAELSLLPFEMFLKRNKTIKVRIGKPISYKTFDKSLSHLEWAQKIKEQVYKLNF